MGLRTDLAVERHEIIGKDTTEGIVSEQFEKNNVKFTSIKVLTESGAEKLGKPVGTYISAEIPDLTQNPVTDSGMITGIAEELRKLIPDEGTVIVAGLGNTDITPDAVGPESVSMVLATRHIESYLSDEIGLGNLRSVADIVPGVLGKTGVESAELIKGIVDSINPSAVIVIDALAARRVSRLGNTVQFSDTGIIPGSGVGNSRNAINRDTMGVPVISIGVPTVVDVQTLISDLTGDKCSISDEEENMIITPREIDIVIQRASEIIALSVNKALQPHLSVDEIMMLVGN